MAMASSILFVTGAMYFAMLLIGGNSHHVIMRKYGLHLGLVLKFIIFPVMCVEGHVEDGKLCICIVKSG